MPTDVNSHLMTALWNRSGGEAGVGVAVADVDEAIGRCHGEMRTPLNLQSLADEGRVTPRPDGTWALTEPSGPSPPVSRPFVHSGRSAASADVA